MSVNQGVRSVIERRLLEQGRCVGTGVKISSNVIGNRPCVFPPRANFSRIARHAYHNAESTRSTPKPPLSTAGRRGRRSGSRRFCCRRSLGTYAVGVLLFLPASLLVLLTAELGYESPGRLLRSWYTKLRRAGSVDEPRRDSYVASELRDALKELQAVKEQLGSTVALTAAPAHGSVGSAPAVGAPVRTAGTARGGQLRAAAAATRSAAPGLLHELQQAQGAPQVGQQQPSEATSEDLIRAALDDVGLEGILGELSESTRRESSEGKELLRQQRASAALRLHEKLSEEEVLRLAEDALPPEQGQPRLWGDLEGDAAGQKYRLPCFEDSAPSDRLVPCRALAAPTQPGA